MTPDEKKKTTRIWPVVKAYSKAAWVYPGTAVAIVVGALIIEAAALYAPLVLKQFIDTLSQAAPSDATRITLFGILGIFALTNFGGWIGQRIRMVGIMKMESRVMVDLSNQAFQYLMRHSHDFFVSNFAGSLTRRVNRYARAFEQVLDTVMFSFFSTAVFAAGAIVVLFQRNIFLGGILLLWTVTFVLIQIFVARWKHPLRVASAAEDSKVTGILSDAVSNQSTVTLFAAAEHEYGLFSRAVESWRAVTMRSWNADAWILAIQGIFALLVEVALLAGGVLLWQRGIITVGDFVLIQVYIIGLVERIWNIGNNMRRVYTAFADAYEMVEILETPYAVQDAPNALPLKVTKGAIQLTNVTFGFNDDMPVLKDLSLSIKPGERIGFVGHSGAGKSTVTKLLLRLYDVTSGTISIDGQNIADVTQDSLREAISFVPQEPILFHRSLSENIRYGKPDATEEEVIEASKKARCHEFIMRLPEGYDTHVGERGIKLSGGERQRVAIARAILKNAPILILDEATSSLDSESEALIQEALDVLMEGKTVIVIAHRLSTIMHMDYIVVIENGSITIQGTHQELLDHEGSLYHTLWNIQAGGFIADI